MKLKFIINELSNFVWILNGKKIMELTLIETNVYLELKRKLSTLSVQMADFQKKIAPSSPEK